MRNGTLSVALIGLLLSGCGVFTKDPNSGPNARRPMPDQPPFYDPGRIIPNGRRVTQPPPLFSRDLTVVKGEPSRTQPVQPPIPPAPTSPPARYTDLIRSMEHFALQNPSNRRLQLRLAGMLAMNEQYEDANRVLSRLGDPSGPASYSGLDLMHRLTAFGVKKNLADHDAADAALNQITVAIHTARGVKITKGLLCRHVTGFEDYVPYDGNLFEPGQRALIYIQIRDFGLKEDGGEYRFHLRYQWKLIDERGEDYTPDKWRNADPTVKEDRHVLQGRRRDFYQSFILPFPVLPRGRYQIHITVIDANRGSDTIKIPIEIADHYPNKR